MPISPKDSRINLRPAFDKASPGGAKIEASELKIALDSLKTDGVISRTEIRQTRDACEQSLFDDRATPGAKAVYAAFLKDTAEKFPAPLSAAQRAEFVKKHSPMLGDELRPTAEPSAVVPVPSAAVEKHLASMAGTDRQVGVFKTELGGKSYTCAFALRATTLEFVLLNDKGELAARGGNQMWNSDLRWF